MKHLMKVTFKYNETKGITIAELKDKLKGHYIFTACFKWIVEQQKKIYRQKEEIKSPKNERMYCH